MSIRCKSFSELAKLVSQDVKVTEAVVASSTEIKKAEIINLFGVQPAKDNASRKRIDSLASVSHSTAKYDTMLVVERVLVKVPKESGFMNFKSSFETQDGKNIPCHWMNGKPLGKVFLNLFFYGLLQQNLGRSIVATVSVIKKMMDDGRNFIMLDVKKTPEEAPVCEIRYPKVDKAEGIHLIGTDHVIEFRPIIVKGSQRIGAENRVLKN